MRLAEDVRGPVLVLRPTGDLDATELPAIDGRVATHLGHGVRHVVFDLSAVGLLPSTAVGVLIQVKQRVRERGGRVALAAVPPLVRGTLTTMGVWPLFRVYVDADAAVRGLHDEED